MTKQRCQECRKKIMLIFECKCGNKYCVTHRLAENHKCDFDFKTLRDKDRDKLEKNKIP